MSTMSISTLKILEQSQMPPAHARAIAKAIEADFTRRLDNLATKTDLLIFKTDLSAQLDRKFDQHRNRAIGLAVMLLGALSGGFTWTVDRQDALFAEMRQTVLSMEHAAEAQVPPKAIEPPEK